MPSVAIKMVKRNPPVFTTFDTAWIIIGEALDNIFDDNTKTVSFEEVYRVVYDVVLTGNANDFYSKLSLYLEEKLTGLRKSTLEGIHKSDKIMFMDLLYQFWTSHKYHFKLIGDLMIYFDKVYCAPMRKLQVIDLCLSVFAHTVLLPLKEQIPTTFNATLDEIRSHCISSNGIITEEDQIVINKFKEIVNMMELILINEDSKSTFYSTIFEPLLLKNTKEFYTTAIDWQSMSTLEIFHKVETLIPLERGLSTSYLNDDTCHKMNSLLEEVLLKGKVTDIVESLVSIAVSKEDFELLQKILLLVVNNDLYANNCNNAIKAYIFNDLEKKINIDQSIKRKTTIGIKWVDQLLDKYVYYHQHLSNLHFPMDRDGKLVGVLLNESFGQYLNVNTKQSIEYICHFTDSKLKLVPTLQLSVDHIKDQLLQVIKFFKLLSEKDELIESYRLQLSKRLLQQRYTHELETFMIKQFSDELGSFLTVNIESMLKDITISVDISRSMKAMSGNKITTDGLTHFEFWPNVLTMTAWPFQRMNEQEEQDIILPSIMRRQLKEFANVYKKRYSQRILKWCHSLGLVEVMYWFGEDKTNLRPYNLVLPFYSALVFLLFVLDEGEQSSNGPWTLERIQSATGMPQEEVTRQLVSLAIAPRFRILKKNPAGLIIHPTDTFSINEDFKSLTETVKVKTVNITSGTATSQRKGKALDDTSQRTLERDRLMTTNATVVRVMKQNKTLLETELFEKCKSVIESHFSLKKETFQRSLHYLVDKEYLAIDPDDPQLYRYL